MSKSTIHSLSTSTNIVKAIDKAILWFGDVLVSPREIGNGYVQDFEWSMNLSLFGSKRSLARSCLSASNMLISPPCTTYNIQFKESQQMNVLTRLTFTSALQAFLSQSRYNYLHRGTHADEINKFNNFKEFDWSSHFKSSLHIINFHFKPSLQNFQISISNLGLQIKIHFKSSLQNPHTWI